MEVLKPGQIVIINCDDLCLTPEGFALGGIVKDGIVLYEKVDLESFPSTSDFEGETTLVQTGDIGCVIRFSGRPSNISKDPKWFRYDIYEIFIKGTVRQAFRQNLEVISP
jgi:hypothetical protein|tara:strand:+ start:3556 stop:3885 length:330 start_codon:yes stop_codon:yes gene_type:complete